jgi:hypothetical protein
MPDQGSGHRCKLLILRPDRILARDKGSVKDAVISQGSPICRSSTVRRLLARYTASRSAAKRQKSINQGMLFFMGFTPLVSVDVGIG